MTSQYNKHITLQYSSIMCQYGMLKHCSNNVTLTFDNMTQHYYYINV